MNSRISNGNIGRLLQLVILSLLLSSTSGCASFGRNTYILTETESYYFIPPNTPFHAQIVKGGPVTEVRRTQPTWAVDGGYLAKLQEAANVAPLNK